VPGDATRTEPKTAVCGIVLHPAGHTRSPAMHDAAFRALDLDAVYEVFDVRPEALADAIAGARLRGIRQLAVSLPHKETVIRYLDAVDETAAAIGAVNTITRRDGRLVGSNTDWIGAVRALERETRLEGKRAVVLGAGGSARAVVYGLLERGAVVTVLNRTLSRAQALARALGVYDAGTLEKLESIGYDVLVNTTSVGLRSDESPVSAEWIAPEAVVMDAVYDPEITRLLRDARERGCRIVPGKWMLVYQAAEQLKLWTGREAPIDVMAAAFDAAGRQEAAKT
jgi:shikimate dehydrogenase